MTIEFETPKPILNQQAMLKTVAENMMRPVSREFDENEHSIPWDYVEFMHTAMKATGGGGLTVNEEPSPQPSPEGRGSRPPIGYQKLAAQIEMLSWGDVGMYLITPGGGLGAADMAMMVTDRGVQIYGGHGYIRENPVELLMRNGRGFPMLLGLMIV